MDHQLYHVRVSGGRRVVLPVEACKQLGIDVGDTVIVDVADGKVELHTFEKTLADFRAMLNSKVPAGVSVVDELIAERRAQSEGE